MTDDCFGVISDEEITSRKKKLKNSDNVLNQVKWNASDRNKQGINSFHNDLSDNETLNLILCVGIYNETCLKRLTVINIFIQFRANRCKSPTTLTLQIYSIFVVEFVALT